MAIKKLPDGRWQVRLQITDRRTGLTVNRKAIRETKHAAEEAERSIRAEGAGGPPPRLTLEAYVRSWAEARAGSWKPSVRTRYRIALERHILPVLGAIYVDALTPSDVQGYVVARVEAGAAGNTVLNELRLIRTISRDSVADRVAPMHWADRVKPPKVARYTEDNPNILTARELAQLLAAVPPHWRRIVTLMATTGLRWGEASGLSWDDVERWEEQVPPGARVPWDVVGQIKIRRSNWRGLAVEPKTQRSYRAVPLLRAAADLLGPHGKGWLFPTADGELHRGTPLRHVLDYAVVKLGWAVWDKSGGTRNQYWRAVGKRITPHGLRRTWNDLARQRGDKQVVQAIVGHVTDAMTEHYSLIRTSEKDSLSSEVGRAAFELEAGDDE